MEINDDLLKKLSKIDGVMINEEDEDYGKLDEIIDEENKMNENFKEKIKQKKSDELSNKKNDVSKLKIDEAKDLIKRMDNL